MSRAETAETVSLDDDPVHADAFVKNHDARSDILKSLKDFGKRSNMAVTIVDPYLDDDQMIFVNQIFCDLTGYTEEECLNRNCRFLQGDDTDREEVKRIRDALSRGEACVVELLNYRKDGSSFWNALHISPVRDDNGAVAYFYGSQWDVTDRIAHRSAEQVRKALSREMHHRLRNLLAVASSIVRLSARGETNPEKLVERASERIHALGRAHETTFSPTGDDFEMGELRSVVQAMLLGASEADRKNIKCDGPELQLPVATITPLALTLHELLINAHEHGALSRDGGVVEVKWHRQDDRLHLIWSESGVGRIDDEAGAAEGYGTRTISGILRSVGGTSDRTWTDDGIRVELTVKCNPQ